MYILSRVGEKSVLYMPVVYHRIVRRVWKRRNAQACSCGGWQI